MTAEVRRSVDPDALPRKWLRSLDLSVRFTVAIPT